MMKLDQKLRQSSFSFCKKKIYFFIASGVMILTGIIVLIFAGFNLGIEFTGGTILNVQFGSEIENKTTYNNRLSEIKDILEENGVKNIAQSQRQGDGSTASIVVRYQDVKGKTEAEMNDISQDIVDAIRVHFDPHNENPRFDVQNSQRIGANSTQKLVQNAVLATLLSILGILIYIAFRFEFLSGLSATLGLIHDALIMISLCVIFRVPINSSFVAAIVTLVGYSINSTIILFDRVRENKQKENYVKLSQAEITNISIKETLTRSLYTGFTTMLAVFLLVILGVSSIKEFIIPILFGLLAGTYSSIFLVGPFYAMLADNKKLARFANYKKRQKAK